jgi:hypothetical protein
VKNHAVDLRVKGEDGIVTVREAAEVDLGIQYLEMRKGCHVD